jgi:hypothetical protein
MIGSDNGIVIKGTAIISDIRYMVDDAQKDSVQCFSASFF